MANQKTETTQADSPNQNQKNGGKGLTRVEIAERAVSRLREQLAAAEARLAAAKKAAAESKLKKRATQADKVAKAKAILRKAGIEVPEAA